MINKLTNIVYEQNDQRKNIMLSTFIYFQTKYGILYIIIIKLKTWN